MAIVTGSSGRGVDSVTSVAAVDAVAMENDVCDVAIVDVDDGTLLFVALGVVPPVVPTSVTTDGRGEALDSEEAALVSGKSEFY